MTQPDMPAVTDQLPHGGTVRDLRIEIAKLARRGEEVFSRTLLDAPPGPLDEPTRELNLMAHGASFYGWSLVALLRWIAETYGDEAGYEAAAMVQNIGADGDFGDWSDDIADALRTPPAGES